MAEVRSHRPKPDHGGNTGGGVGVVPHKRDLPKPDRGSGTQADENSQRRDMYRSKAL
jgi:hypothetical protein